LTGLRQPNQQDGKEYLDDDLALRDYLQIANRHRTLLLLSVGLGFCLALGANHFIRPLFKATTTVRIDPSSMGQNFLLETLAPTSRNLIGTEIEVLQSRTIVAKAIEGLDLQASLPKNLDHGFDDLVNLVRKKYLSAEAPRNTDIIDIEIKWYTPETAARLANRLSTEYIRSNILRKQTEAKLAREFLDLQIVKMKAQFEQAGKVYSLQESKVNELLYQSLLEKRAAAQIQEHTTISNAWIVDPAEVPLKPYLPRKSFNILLGLVGGILFGILLVILVEYFDDRIHNPADAEGLTGKPVLGVIPWIPYKQNGRAEATPNASKHAAKGTLSKRLITSIGMGHPIVESYRGLRTNLLYTHPDNPKKILLITSSEPSEGKTLTTANLALVISRTGKKVVVIDADMRKPMQHIVFGISQSPGLSDLLSGQAKNKNVVVPSKDGDIHIVPSGKSPPNPPELLGGRKMKDFIQKLATRFDYVLIDSPPILNVTDPAVLLPIIDGVILISRAGSSSGRALTAAVRLMDQTTTPILGIGLNAVSTNHRGSSYAHAGYYYGENLYGKTTDEA